MGQRQDTCTPKCPFWKRYGEMCPNFVEGIWETAEGEKYTVVDCAPKRTMILTQQMYDHVVGTRRDYNQMRNATVEILKMAGNSVGIELITEAEVVDQKSIEDQTNGKDTG